MSQPGPQGGETHEVEVEVRLTDSAVYVGSIHVAEGVRVLDFVNATTPFFSLVERNGRVRLIAKAQVVQIIPYDRGNAPGHGAR